MTIAEARALAQGDPVPVLTARWGDTAALARQRVAALTDSLRDLQTLTEQLASHDLQIGTDLGPVGNAAMSAWKTCQHHAVKHAPYRPPVRLPEAS